MKDHPGSPADQRIQYYFAAWTLAWAISYAGATGILDRTPLDGFAAWAVAIAPNLVALVALVAFLRFLRQSDELIQKINLEALALGFAVGVLLAMGYPLLAQAGAPELGGLAGPLLGAAMLIVFSLGQLYGNLRYR